MTYLLDTSAVLALYLKEPEADQVLVLFDDPQRDILLSSLSSVWPQTSILYCCRMGRAERSAAKPIVFA